MKVTILEGQRDATRYRFNDLIFVLQQKIAEARETADAVTLCKAALTAAEARHNLALAAVSAAQRRVDDRMATYRSDAPEGTIWKEPKTA